MPDPVTPPVVTPPVVTPPVVTPPAPSAMGGVVTPPTGDDWAPERLRVKTADGKLDTDATGRKLATAYGELEKRMKDVGSPPESPDKYEIAAAKDEDKELIAEITADPAMKEFVKNAHAAGYSNKQINLAVNAFLPLAKSLVEGAGASSADECRDTLKEVWKSDAEMTKNMATAKRAVLAFGASIGVKFEEVEQSGLANNPLFCRIMAGVGKEMGEDTAANDTNGNAGGKTLDQQIDENYAELQKLDLNDPKRRALLDARLALMERKHPSQKPLLKGAA
jgi:hypothetical protein